MEAVEQIARLLHSWVRWGVVLVAVIAAVYLAAGWLRNVAWQKTGQTLLTVFSSLIGLQWLIGLVLLGVWGSLSDFGQRHFYEHLTVMTIALIVAHLHIRWKRDETMPDKNRYRNGFLLILGVTVLVVVGIAVLPEGIQWRFYTP